jgi:hypothetical protein
VNIDFAAVTGNTVLPLNFKECTHGRETFLLGLDALYAIRGMRLHERPRYLPKGSGMRETTLYGRPIRGSSTWFWAREARITGAQKRDRLPDGRTSRVLE